MFEVSIIGMVVFLSFWLVVLTVKFWDHKDKAHKPKKRQQKRVKPECVFTGDIPITDIKLPSRRPKHYKRYNPVTVDGKPDMALRIYNLRNKKHYTRNQLAQMIGVDPSAIYLWENRKNKPYRYNLESLASALGVTVEYLKNGNDFGPRATNVS